MNAPFALFRDDLAGREVLFEQPSEIIVARSADEFEPALAAVQEAHEAGKWLCVIAMLLGRLEIFPLLVIATPSFWRR